MSDIKDYPFEADLNDFLLTLEFAAAEAVVDFANFTNLALVKTQCCNDAVLADLYETLDITPADWGVIKALWCESNHAQWLREQHQQEEAATAAYFVAQGDG